MICPSCRTPIITEPHEHDAVIVHMRDKLHMSFLDIGAKFGFTRQNAQRIYKRAKEAAK